MSKERERERKREGGDVGKKEKKIVAAFQIETYPCDQPPKKTKTPPGSHSQTINNLRKITSIQINKNVETVQKYSKNKRVG